MSDEELKQYAQSGGPFYSIKSIDTYRDGGTIVIETTKSSFFISTKNEISKIYKENDPLTILEIKFLIERIKRFHDTAQYQIVHNNIVPNVLLDKTKTHETI